MYTHVQLWLGHDHEKGAVALHWSGLSISGWVGKVIACGSQMRDKGLDACVTRVWTHAGRLHVTTRVPGQHCMFQRATRNGPLTVGGYKRGTTSATNRAWSEHVMSVAHFRRASLHRSGLCTKGGSLPARVFTCSIYWLLACTPGPADCRRAVQEWLRAAGVRLDVLGLCARTSGCRSNVC